ncbi:L,D-transpeptidase family protein [Microbacterium fluvii]|uniref:L,D-transpeptidase family protein n=1 Tax=Microbacterium fluvii TaxID=415215 RepID=A0ABW2H9C4_9MICO|nr:L,D-transpeptidase family protein [Microbacterium fluvii]MCU4671325.1 L,D-transpeptidase/peptidoglycan binding protein [Microbacterium fluvii]
MTDLATKPESGETPGGDGSEPTYAWAPAEPEPKKRHLGWWIGVPAAVAVVGLVASSLVLVAPGTAVAGVGIGGLTSGAAADAIQSRLADTTIVLTGAGGDAEVTGADLGASVDAKALADAAFAEHPMWNVTAWNATTDADVHVDAEAAASVLRAAAPELYTDPVDATIAFDADAGEYAVTPAVDGEGIDVSALQQALQAAFDAGRTRVEVDPTQAPVTPATTTETAQATVDQLNTAISKAGFYVGKERTVKVKAATAASWITVTPATGGGFDIAVDQSAIQKVVDGLPKKVDRKAVNAVTITDTDGKVLRTDVEGVEGRELLSTDHVAERFAAQLAEGNGVYRLEVAQTPFDTTAYARRLEVDLSTQTAYLFQNGKVFRSYAISSGKSGTPTDQGHFRIYAKVRIQDMGGPSFGYLTENVPWISYYNGDEAFHGAYWHNNFGHPMSHGCVNMPVDVAKFVYDWAPVGTEVWVHA